MENESVDFRLAMGEKLYEIEAERVLIFEVYKKERNQKLFGLLVGGILAAALIWQFTKKDLIVEEIALTIFTVGWLAAIFATVNATYTKYYKSFNEKNKPLIYKHLLEISGKPVERVAVPSEQKADLIKTYTQYWQQKNDEEAFVRDLDLDDSFIGKNSRNLSFLFGDATIITSESNIRQKKHFIYQILELGADFQLDKKSDAWKKFAYKYEKSFLYHDIKNNRVVCLDTETNTERYDVSILQPLREQQTINNLFKEIHTAINFFEELNQVIIPTQPEPKA
jgi:hypothetical protein